jgi:hypothetical protein
MENFAVLQLPRYIRRARVVKRCLLGATWSYLELLGATWSYLELLGATWSYLELLGASQAAAALYTRWKPQRSIARQHNVFQDRIDLILPTLA